MYTRIKSWDSTITEAHGKPLGHGLEILFTGDTMIRVPCAFFPLYITAFPTLRFTPRKSPVFIP